MTTAEIIQAIGIIASIATSIVAIAISVKTMRLNSQMIEESTRPIVIIYNNIVSADSPIQYLIIRNFGNSAAIIDELNIECEEESIYSKSIFSDMKGQIIAPGQSYSTAFKFEKMDAILIAKITYSTSSGKTYKDTFNIRQAALKDHTHAKTSVGDLEESARIIAGSFQDYLRARL